MSRNIDTTLAAGLANASIEPIILASLTFESGTVNVWSGVGDLVWNSNTFQGVGALGTISSVSEGTSVQADGMTLTLSGIPTSGLDIPYVPGSTPPSGVTPPVAVPTGQAIAWIEPNANANSGSTSFKCFGVWQAAQSATSTDTSGQITMSGSCSQGWPTAFVKWSGFQAPKLPPGSVIEAIYPVVVASGTQANTYENLVAGVGATTTNTMQLPGGTYSGQYAPSPSLGADASTVSGAWVEANILQSASGDGYPDYVNVSYVALAVYYTPGEVTLITETMDDIRLGAPAKVYFGLLSNGAILGTPYLIFGGTVDQPNIRIGPDTMTISLALENRLSNLQRANQRRYTSADQRQQYSDDTAFSWVELENDMALRWG